MTKGHHLKFLCGRYKEGMVEGISLPSFFLQPSTFQSFDLPPFPPSDLPTFPPSNLPTFLPSDLPSTTTFQPFNHLTFQPFHSLTLVLFYPPTLQKFARIAKIVKPKSKSPIPCPKSKKPKNPILWTGTDTIITWATTHPKLIIFVSQGLTLSTASLVLK